MAENEYRFPSEECEIEITNLMDKGRSKKLVWHMNAEFD